MVTDGPGRELLLSLARQSIVTGLGRRAAAALPATGSLPEALLRPAACFVTLRHEGRLRGCRGLLEAARPLAHDVWLNAWASAFDDPRFPPLASAEIPGLGIEVSVLSALEPIAAGSRQQLLAGLEPGTHGLVLELGPRRATFLPQVWDSLPEPGRFLGELLAKAGLPADRWSPDISAWRYRAESIR